MSADLFADLSQADACTISASLGRFGAPVLAYAAERGMRLRLLARGERYSDASPVLAKLGIDVDLWPVPPAGLFVVEERTIYARSLSPMTLAHEFGHALDCALGGGVYRSGYDERIRAAFREARAFVTPYAATGLDEYFAESVRAYVGVNDPRSPWPKVSRARLAKADPTMSALVAEFFVEMGA
jgi:hypothetical protein